MRKIISFIMIFIISLTFVACNNNKEGKGEKKEALLIYGSASDYSRINPAIDEHGEIHSLIFRGLTKHDEDANIVMDMAKEITVSNDFLRYDIELKQGIKWHDGEEFNSEDVKFTLDSINDSKNLSEISSNYKEIKEVVINNDYNLTLIMKNKCSAIMDYLSIGMIPKHVFKEYPIYKDEANKNPIGTGPYKLTKWENGSYIELQAFDDFYGSKASIDKVVFKIIPDEKMRLLQLQSGEINLTQLEPRDLKAIDSEKLNIYERQTADYRGVMFNFSKDIFKDNNFIKAMCYTIDKDKIIEVTLDNKGQKAYSPLQKSKYYLDLEEKYDFDIQKSKELLLNNGYVFDNKNKLMKNGEKIEFRLTVFEGDPIRVDMAKMVAANLQDIGINVILDISSKIDWDNLDAFLIGWGSPFDPDDHTYKVFNSNEIETGMNLNFYKNEVVDEALENARKYIDYEKRKTYYDKFQIAINEQPPFAFIAYIDSLYASNLNIKNLNNNILGHHGVGFLSNIEEWEIEVEN